MLLPLPTRQQGKALIKGRNSAQADFMDSDSGDDSEKGRLSTKYSCYLCEGGHFMRDCTRLTLAKKLLKRYDKEKKI